MLRSIGKIYSIFKRKKSLSVTTNAESSLAKVLTTLDLTGLAIGSTLGVGVYVLAGEVAKLVAGPAVVLSFLIAAIASVFAGLCYAEFGARVPKAGSAYVYSYVTIGEFIAFIIGWNLILEYGIGSASVVKGLSVYLDSLIENKMSNFFKEYMSINVSFLGEYPDFFAFGVIMIFSIGLALGAKESSRLTNVFTLLNLCVVLFVVICGAFKANPDNWSIPKEHIPELGYGVGGFAPYGLRGVIKGAAICFYGFIGFDCIATAGEEAKNPKKSIPIAILVSLSAVFLAYFSISTVLTMMLPYYEQDIDSPLPSVFRYYGWDVAVWIVSIGAIFGLFASLMGAMFPLPRVIYAMSSDGLLFEIMGRIHPRFKTPFIGTLIAGTLTGTLAALFNKSQLVNMMSIGTLMAYSIVAASVLLLRFEVDSDYDDIKDNTNYSKEKFTFAKLFNSEKLQTPTLLTSALVTWSTTVYCVFCITFGLIIVFLGENIVNLEWYAILLLILNVIILILILVIISKQPRSCKELTFTVPLVPWLPALSILINIYLMLELDYMTWIRFFIWVLIGISIYFSYGIRNSKLKTNNNNLKSNLDGYVNDGLSLNEEKPAEKDLGT